MVQQTGITFGSTAQTGSTKCTTESYINTIVNLSSVGIQWTICPLITSDWIERTVDMNDKKVRLKKLRALALRGIDGEKEQAQATYKR